MKFILLMVVCLVGAVLSAPALTLQKREILPGDPRFGTDHHHHNHGDRVQSPSNDYLAPAIEAAQSSASENIAYLPPAEINNEPEFQSASNNYLAPALEAAQSSQSLNNRYLEPEATNSVGPVVAEPPRPMEPVPQQTVQKVVAERQIRHQQTVQNTVVQLVPEADNPSEEPVHQQTIQNTVIQTAPQNYGSGGPIHQHAVQNTVIQIGAHSESGAIEPLQQVVQNTVVQSIPETSGDSVNQDNANDFSLSKSSGDNDLGFGQQGESSDNVLQASKSNDQEIAQAPKIYHYRLTIQKHPQQVQTLIELPELGKIDVSSGNEQSGQPQNLQTLIDLPQLGKIDVRSGNEQSEQPQNLQTLIDLPQLGKIDVRSGDEESETERIDDGEAHASQQYEQMTLIGSNGGYVY